MSGVVLRCPNCGTVQPAEGQCDACHEAAVRFFCTNHKPGMWLEGSVCPQCGARFGDPVPVRPAPAPAAPPRVVPPEVGIPPTRRSPEAEEAELWDTGVPTRMDPGHPAPAGPDPFRILLGAMMHAARARSARADSVDHEAPVRMRLRSGGCLSRLLVLLLLIVAMVFLAPVFFGMFFGF